MFINFLKSLSQQNCRPVVMLWFVHVQKFPQVSQQNCRPIGMSATLASLFAHSLNCFIIITISLHSGVAYHCERNSAWPHAIAENQGSLASVHSELCVSVNASC